MRIPFISGLLSAAAAIALVAAPAGAAECTVAVEDAGPGNTHVTDGDSASVLGDFDSAWVGTRPGPAMYDSTPGEITIAVPGSKRLDIEIAVAPTVAPEAHAYLVVLRDHYGAERFVAAQRAGYAMEWTFTHGFVGTTAAGNEYPERGLTTGSVDASRGLVTIELVGDFVEPPPVGEERTIEIVDVQVLTRLVAGRATPALDDAADADTCTVLVHERIEP